MNEQEQRALFFQKTGRIATSEQIEYQAFIFGLQVGAASRDAEIVAAQNNADLDALQADNAELVAALKPFGAIDLVESQLPAEFAMLILRARAAIAKVRKP